MSTFNEPTMKDAMDTIARQAIRISHLELETTALRNELEVLRNSPDRHNLQGDDTSSPRPLENGSTTDHSGDHSEELPQKYADLSAKFSQLESKHSQCATRIEKLNQKYQHAKQYCRAWSAYAAKKRIQHQQDHLPPTPGLEPDPAFLVGDETTTPEDLQLPSLSRMNVQNNHLSDLLPELAAPTSSAVSRPPRVTSSQTTVFDESANQSTGLPGDAQSDADDLPEVVSARPVKRKAGKTAMGAPSPRRVKIKQEPNSPDAAIELSSDIPENDRRTPERHLLAEMSDLNDVGPAMITPRLNARTRNIGRRATSEGAAIPAPQLMRSSSSLSENDARPLATTSKTSRQHEHAAPTGPLRPLSVNVPTLPRTAKSTKAPPTSRRRSKAQADVALLSEDGDDRTSQNEKQAQQEKNGEKAVDLRLDGLLNERPSERTPIFNRRPQHTALPKAGALVSPHMPTPVSTIKQVSPAKRKNQMRYGRTPRESPAPVRPEEEPLRIRDPSTLQLEDFRINPKYMGTDFAFADTVRGRDARRGLHTCTRSDCCGGALKQAVLIGGTSLSGKTDSQALEAYLGPEYERHISSYGEDQKKQITVQAHAYVFAEKHGKHKQAFERRSTPPGFWNTDFPTTQEATENRVKAQEMEREAVAERWREAMRENGRWKFRDE